MVCHDIDRYVAIMEDEEGVVKSDEAAVMARASFLWRDATDMKKVARGKKQEVAENDVLVSFAYDRRTDNLPGSRPSLAVYTSVCMCMCWSPPDRRYSCCIHAQGKDLPVVFLPTQRTGGDLGTFRTTG